MNISAILNELIVEEKIQGYGLHDLGNGNVEGGVQLNDGRSATIAQAADGQLFVNKVLVDAQSFKDMLTGTDLEATEVKAIDPVDSYLDGEDDTLDETL